MNKIIIFTLLIFSTIRISYSQEKIFNSVELNKVLTAEIGESLITTGEINRIDAVEITEAFEIKSGFTKFNFEKNDIYPFVEKKKGYNIYYSRKNYKDGRYWGVAINDKDENEIFPILISSAGLIAKLKKYQIQNKISKIEIINRCDNCYQYQFIYGGKSDNNLKFTYREFIGDLARPSFFQEVEYDITEENIIGFKGLRIKIIDSSNTLIKYEILQDFDK